jgi:hypothetical protein
MKPVFLPALAFAFLVLPGLAEDWTTSDGKTYQDVKVIRSDSRSVTILTQDGEVAIPLANLPPEIQKRFGSPVASASPATSSAPDEKAARDKALRSAVYVYGLVTYKDSRGALLIDCNAPPVPNTFQGQSFPAGRSDLSPFSDYQNTVVATGSADAAQGRRAFGTIFLLGATGNVRRGDTVGVTAYPAGRYTDQRGTFHAYTTQLP